MGKKVSKGFAAIGNYEKAAKKRVHEALSARMRHEIPEETGKSGSVGTKI